MLNWRCFHRIVGRANERLEDWNQAAFGHLARCQSHQRGWGCWGTSVNRPLGLKPSQTAWDQDDTFPETTLEDEDRRFVLREEKEPRERNYFCCCGHVIYFWYYFHWGNESNKRFVVRCSSKPQIISVGTYVQVRFDLVEHTHAMYFGNWVLCSSTVTIQLCWWRCTFIITNLFLNTFY